MPRNVRSNYPLMQCHPPEEQNLQLRRYENSTHRITALLPYPLIGHHIVLRSPPPKKKKLALVSSYTPSATNNDPTTRLISV